MPGVHVGGGRVDRTVPYTFTYESRIAVALTSQHPASVITTVRRRQSWKVKPLPLNSSTYK